MNTVFVFFHVAAAIILLGPVVVATSRFPAEAVRARQGGEESTGRASVLHSITKTYGSLSLLVPLLGAVVMAFDWDSYKTNYWLHTAIILSVIAWAILFGMVIPQQRKIMHSLGSIEAVDATAADATANFEQSKAKAAAGAGIFNLMWVLTLILMFLPNPGTGATPSVNDGTVTPTSSVTAVTGTAATATPTS